jgi:hypothetical protein
MQTHIPDASFLTANKRDIQESRLRRMRNMPGQRPVLFKRMLQQSSMQSLHTLQSWKTTLKKRRTQRRGIAAGQIFVAIPCRQEELY